MFPPFTGSPQDGGLEQGRDGDLEDSLLPISALQHLVFCERQWGLIHLEQVWLENMLTAKGRIMHEKVDEMSCETRPNVVISRGMHVRSLRLGLAGRVDVVEFVRAEEAEGAGGLRLAGRRGLWRPVPVEYKLGRPKMDRCDEVQLCAQALCLEEMLGVSVDYGALFYGRPRRRSEVHFGAALRRATEAAAVRLHQLTRQGITPRGRYSRACLNCSLYEYCLPKVAGEGKSAVSYMARIIKEHNGGDD
ncbi:MAG: CRISPR-associated protein Cas4 [Peptococcaceae bacterium]|nr:CRISPR-associated protein Cas4 [Peptococcaceae bacterium]